MFNLNASEEQLDFETFMDHQKGWMSLDWKNQQIILHSIRYYCCIFLKHLFEKVLHNANNITRLFNFKGRIAIGRVFKAYQKGSEYCYVKKMTIKKFELKNYLN